MNTIFPTEYFNVENKIYGYNTSIVNELVPNFLDNKKSQVNVYRTKSEFDKIIYDMDSYSLKNSLSGNFLDVYLGTDLSTDSLNVRYFNNGYGNLSLDERQKMGVDKSYFSEDINRTYLYVALPKGVNFVDNLQKIYTKNITNNSVSEHDVIPGDQTIGYKTACEIRDIMNFWEDENLEETSNAFEGTKTFREILSRLGGLSIRSIVKSAQTKIENEIFEYVDTSGVYIDLLRKIPGKFGDFVSLAITLGASLEEITQRRHVEEIGNELGKDYTINRIKMYPFESSDMFSDLIIGRDIRLDFSKNSNYSGENIYLIIPSLTFMEKSQNSKSSSLEDIIFDFKL